MRDGGGQKGQAVVPSSSSSGSLNQIEGWGLEGVFGRGKYKLWALAAITLLALWTMFTGTTVTRKWSDVNLKHSDPSSLHSDLDILNEEEEGNEEEFNIRKDRDASQWRVYRRRGRE